MKGSEVVIIGSNTPQKEGQREVSVSCSVPMQRRRLLANLPKTENGTRD